MERQFDQTLDLNHTLNFSIIILFAILFY